jgi:exodeoxyribonuclease VII small subunit
LKIKNSNSKETKDSGKELKFEESLERLESIVQEMESGDLALEDILKKYEEGNKLIKFCASKLNDAEKRIEVLMKDKNGSLSLEEFDLDNEEEESKEEKNGTSAKKSEEQDLF